MPNLSFNGQVQDMGSREQWTTYDLGFTGEDLEALKAFVVSEIKRRGVEAVSPMSQAKKDGKWTVSVRVRSSRGIV